MDAEPTAYRVETEQGGFAVVDPSERIVLTCRDRHSAEQYAALLSTAYRAGYRAGARAERSV